jgi:hypothetical protein
MISGSELVGNSTSERPDLSRNVRRRGGLDLPRNAGSGSNAEPAAERPGAADNDDGAMDEQILTSVSAAVDPIRDGELVEGFNALLGGALPDGLVRTELLRGQDGTWRIQSLWRDRAALMTARETGERPAALVLFERVGAEHAHEVLTVAASKTA